MKHDFDFETAMKRLQEISNLLESDELALDKAIELFEEGLSLSKECQDTLKTYETRVKDLVKEHQNNHD